MSACRSRLGASVLGIWFVFFAACLSDNRAQEAATVSAKNSVCPTGGAAFADPLSKPHWNGWGVDPTQHRFQPADMARLAPSDAPRLKLKWAFGFPGAKRSVASAGDKKRPENSTGIAGSDLIERHVELAQRREAKRVERLGPVEGQ